LGVAAGDLVGPDLRDGDAARLGVTRRGHVHLGQDLPGLPDLVGGAGDVDGVGGKVTRDEVHALGGDGPLRGRRGEAAGVAAAVAAAVAEAAEVPSITAAVPVAFAAEARLLLLPDGVGHDRL